MTGGIQTRMVALEDQQPGRERSRRCGRWRSVGDETAQFGNALRQPERRLMVSLQVVGTVGIAGEPESGRGTSSSALRTVPGSTFSTSTVGRGSSPQPTVRRQARPRIGRQRPRRQATGSSRGRYRTPPHLISVHEQRHLSSPPSRRGQLGLTGSSDVRGVVLVVRDVLAPVDRDVFVVDFVER